MNPIQPLSSRREINVAEPISPALERVKQMLFQPFDLGKWFVIGFCAWLAGLGESGGGFNTGFNHGFNRGVQSNTSLRQVLEQARDYVTANLYWIVPVAIAAVILLLTLGILFLWLNSRGKFMFLHCVALDRAEVVEPWNKFEREGNSLFLFRLVLGLCGMVLTLPLLLFIVVTIGRMILRGEADVAGIVVSVGLVLGLVGIALVLAIIHKFTADFVVPILFLRGGKCLAAWREFYHLLAANPGQFVLYLLFQIVLGMVIGIIVLGTILITCCIAGCLMALPYLGTVVLLPVLVFKRSYSAHFLAQFGAAYDVFPPPAEVPPSPDPLRQPA